ncbi:EamA/RhaT family transporter [Carbonactinospora thermoautotrophica]|uniref:DMT family transporter n=1 Tax=Carbonactinospora thermoautotrophica TaxID=1469144 RepID=UPI00226EF063|nr:DMT family transporter [Carbonactinospora thermoautotrophica]MCX9189870.1 EamA/RhaT family transporter [Carbonactinospora thermoautotrophica]
MSRRSWVLFAAVSVLWGIPYLLIKVAIAELPSAWVVFARVALAAALLLPLAWHRRLLHPLAGRLGWLLGLALVQVSLPFLLITVGEQYVSSGLAGLLIATQPTFIALLAARTDPAERLTPVRAAGLGIGLAGVVLLLGPTLDGDARQLLGAALVLSAAFSYAVGSVLVKRRFSDVPPLGLTAGTLGVSTLLLAPLALADPPGVPPSPVAAGSLVVLGVACTAVAFLAYFSLIGTSGPGRASLVTYVNPVVAAALGAAVLAEPVTQAMLAGSALVLAGSWLAARRPAPGPLPARTPQEHAPARRG